MIKVTWSNDLESLAAELSFELARQRAPGPEHVLTRRHCVVVQSRLMEQWFKHSVLYAHAPHAGGHILANIDFGLLHVFVNDWLYRMDHRDERRDPGDHPFALNSLLWRIYAELNHPETVNDEMFGPVRAYLAAGGDDAASRARRRFVLARQVAAMLDRYMLYRPEMMRAWERGGNDGASGADVGWQPVLWRALVSEGRQSQTYLSAFCRMAGELRNSGVEKPFHAVHVFGVSMMPRLYLNFFDRLSDLVDTRFYLLNPSGEDWDSCMTPREELAYAQRRLRMENLPDLEPLLGYTNPLLASMGRGCRDFLGEVIDLTEGNTDGAFVARNPKTVLARIQNSLLENALPETTPMQEDKSLQLHICHSPMRELEALRDFLLSCFDENPALQPREVQVLVPDIMTYAPLIDAIFAPQAANDPAWIPYMIADAMTSGETVLHEAFRRILRLADSRFAAPEVIELLQCENIRKAFQISEADLDTMYALVRSAGVRWGRSAHHRDEALNMKDLSGQTTWRHGLDRLFLGYALTGDQDPGEGMPLPCDRVEGDDARVLGELAHFVAALEEEADFARGSHLPEEWADHIESTVSRFFISTDETYNEVSALHRAVRRLRQSLEASGIQERLPVGVVREFLESNWADLWRAEERVSNGVIFSALRAGSSAPRRVVCLLGMSDGQFPRSDRRFAYDLMKRTRHRGDQSVRVEDRMAFLEVVLNTRDCLYISYAGRTLRDESIIVPSAAVEELLEFAEMAAGPDAVYRVEHKLQAFHPDYFRSGGVLSSYDMANAQVAMSVIKSRGEMEPGALPKATRDNSRQDFSTISLPEGVISLEALVRFFQNPARAFCRDVLKADLEIESRVALSDSEEFVPRGLAAFDVQTAVIQAICENRGPSEVHRRLLEEGRLPLQQWGEHWFKSRWDEIRENLEVPLEGKRTVKSLLAGQEPLHEDLHELWIGDTCLTGVCCGVKTEGDVVTVDYRGTAFKGRDYLSSWIRHLFASAAGWPGKRYYLSGNKPDKISREKKLFHPLDAEVARAHLLELLRAYGLARERLIPFMPQTAYEFARKLHGGAGIEKALRAASGAWEGDDYVRGELADPSARLLFGVEGPMRQPGFTGLAAQIFEPALGGETRD